MGDGGEVYIDKAKPPPVKRDDKERKSGTEGSASKQWDPTDSIRDVKDFISTIKTELKSIDEKLKEIKKKANGAVRVKMPLSAKVNSIKSGKGKKPSSSQQDTKKYEMVLTWGDDSDDVQKKRPKLEHQELPQLDLQKIPLPPGTEWKITSVKPPVVGGPN